MRLKGLGSCHHNVRVIYEDDTVEHFFNTNEQKTTSTIQDLLEDRWFIATASLVYRNHFKDHEFADWYASAAAGDWALVIQLAAQGKIHYFNVPMGVYRKHSKRLSHIHAVTNHYFLQNSREMFNNVNVWLNYKYDDTIQQTVHKYDELLDFG